MFTIFNKNIKTFISILMSNKMFEIFDNILKLRKRVNIFQLAIKKYY